MLTVRDISRKNFCEGQTFTGASEREKRFFELIHAGFAHKRKFVRKNLLEAKLPSGDIPEKARAEDVPLAMWLSLTEEKNRSSD